METEFEYPVSDWPYFGSITHWDGRIISMQDGLHKDMVS